MQFKKTIIVAAAASLVQAEEVHLRVKSDNSEINGNSLGFPHSGAGINYAFLGTSGQTQALDYDESEGTLKGSETGSFPQVLGVSGHFVDLGVLDPNGKWSFEGNTLQFNGTADNFYACKNTGDPYNYSSRSYQLVHYKADAPEGCLSLTLVKDGESPSGSSTTARPTSTAGPSSSLVPTDSVSSATFIDGAAQYAPGAFAVAAGFVAALL
ncbi:hypothetical protein CAS74_004622 [Pichia kudriavzevii]|uniref:Cell wall protein RHD3 n=1 Tax=Pichia kudriavzevii TaxID=4909 RepID=A0A099P556_PICKU|nr:uncharacterized protein C5L36_0B11367 [Pichia kudriavzevii]AWU75904.1 hypothetical protein C5L36_0B11367 [Pichia kudriavzevii]KGK39347.1 hypothetical protein JL09_g1564 [Pichia kudriavzevii]ONH77079.1 Cell wall protein RHD3 [Pichia kudriavzevii]OUT20374.1 hypothetical protein CAS74_004622 [Pichia kudriavzevii]